MSSKTDELLDLILEGNGSKVISELKKVKMDVLKAEEVDEKYIESVYTLFRAVDYFYNNDVLVDAKINERVYNTLKYKTTIDNDLGLSKLLKFITNCIAEVVKYGYCVFGAKMDRSNELNSVEGKYKDAYNFDCRLLNVYDCYVNNGDLIYDAEDEENEVNVLEDEGYEIFKMEGAKRNGNIISILEVLTAKHYTFSNLYNIINGLSGFNMCVVDTEKAQDDLEFISGERIKTDLDTKKHFMSFVGNQAKNVKNNDMVIGTGSMGFQRVSFVDGSLGMLADNFTNRCNQDIQVAIIGQAGTTMETNVGSQARSETMRETTNNIRDYDIEMVKQMFVELLRFFDIKGIRFDYIFDDVDDDSEVKKTEPPVAIKPVRKAKQDADVLGGSELELQAEDTALNESQVSSLLEIINKVSEGNLPIETARCLINSAFPFMLSSNVDAMLNPFLDKSNISGITNTEAHSGNQI